MPKFVFKKAEVTFLNGCYPVNGLNIPRTTLLKITSG